MEKIDICFYNYMQKGSNYFSDINIFELYFGIYNILNNNVIPVDLHGDNICFKLLDEDRVYIFENKKIVIKKGSLGLKLIDFGMYISQKIPEVITGNDMYEALFIIFSYIYEEYNDKNKVNLELIDFLRSKKAREDLAINNIKYMFNKYGYENDGSSSSSSSGLNNYNVITYDDEKREKILNYSKDNECINKDIVSSYDTKIPSSFVNDFNKLFPVIKCSEPLKHIDELKYYWGKMSAEEKKPYEELQRIEDEELEKLKQEAKKNYILINREDNSEGKELLNIILNKEVPDFGFVKLIYYKLIDKNNEIFRDFIIKTSNKEKLEILNAIHKKTPIEYRVSPGIYMKYKDVTEILIKLRDDPYEVMGEIYGKVLNYYKEKMNKFELQEY